MSTILKKTAMSYTHKDRLYAGELRLIIFKYSELYNLYMVAFYCNKDGLPSSSQEFPNTPKGKDEALQCFDLRVKHNNPNLKCVRIYDIDELLK